MFWRSKTTIDDPLLGTLTLARTASHWRSAVLPTPWGPVTLSVAGDRRAPARQALAEARRLLAHPPASVVDAARTFVLADPEAAAFCGGHGELTLEGFSFDATGAMSVEFTLSRWRDAMLSVVFDEDRPREVHLAD